VFLWGFTATKYLQYISIYISTSLWHYCYPVLAKSSTAASRSYAAAAALLCLSPASSSPKELTELTLEVGVCALGGSAANS